MLAGVVDSATTGVSEIQSSRPARNPSLQTNLLQDDIDPGRVPEEPRHAAHATSRAASLGEALVPQANFGYDVMVFVGRERFLRHRQRQQIQAALCTEYGIPISTGEVSKLARRFLGYLARLHRERAPQLREALANDGGWPMHIDATGEHGRGTLLAVEFHVWVEPAAGLPAEAGRRCERKR